MNPLYWLEVAKTARYAKHLSNHYILKVQNKFMVFTSKPIPKTHLVSNWENIMGESKPQYICETIHTFDPTHMTVKIVEKGAMFYIKNQEVLEPFIIKLTCY